MWRGKHNYRPRSRSDGGAELKKFIPPNHSSDRSVLQLPTTRTRRAHEVDREALWEVERLKQQLVSQQEKHEQELGHKQSEIERLQVRERELLAGGNTVAI